MAPAFAPQNHASLKELPNWAVPVRGIAATSATAAARARAIRIRVLEAEVLRSERWRSLLFGRVKAPQRHGFPFCGNVTYYGMRRGRMAPGDQSRPVANRKGRERRSGPTQLRRAYVFDSPGSAGVPKT